MALKNKFSPTIFIIPDLILMYLGLYLSLIIRYRNIPDGQLLSVHLRAFTIVFAIWLLILFVNNVFDIFSLRRYSTLILNLFSASIAGFIAAALYFYYQPALFITPRRFLLLDVFLTFALLACWHLFVKYMLSGKISEGVYLFSFNNELAELEKEIHFHSYMGFRVLGHLDAGQINSNIKGAGIILTDEISANPDVLRKLYELRQLGVNFYNSKEFYEMLLRRVYLSRFNELWFLENIDYGEKYFYNVAKRLLDIVFGLVLMVLFLITFPFVYVIQTISSPGPLLFIQERVGKNGKIFKVYKYRTMDAGAKSSGWTSSNDPRIYKFGKYLRITRLDELPQFINLLAGTMSAVGPRPEQVQIVEQMKAQIPFYDERHLVKPGITGWAQLNVYAASVEETILKLQYDLYYIKRRSILFDLEIILKTIYYVLAGSGR